MSDLIRCAEISSCGRFRYSLSREWAPPSDGGVTWIMLNPSTADAEVDDPTIRKCVGFSRAWGFRSLRVVNLFAFRTAYPREMLMAGYPVGDRNDDAILKAARAASDDGGEVIAAWGAMLKAFRPRARQVFDLLTGPPYEFTLHCLGLSKAGDPRHPLMLPYATPRVRLERRP